MPRRVDNTRVVLWALAGLTAICLLLPGLPTQNPLSVAVDQRLSPPNNAHWFGTDELGRDMLSRVVSGTALTVGVSVAALLSSLAIGILFGAVAGRYYGRWPDNLFLWVADLLTAVPFLIVIAAVLSVTGPGLAKAYAVLSGIIWVSPARIVRAEILKTLPLQYVAADRALGSPEWRIMFLTVIPATVSSAITFSVSYLPEIIALEAGLSFLGLGVQPPKPSLGKMIFDGLTYINAAWWMAVVPAAALFLIVTGVQVIAWCARRERGAH